MSKFSHERLLVRLPLFVALFAFAMSAWAQMEAVAPCPNKGRQCDFNVTRCGDTTNCGCPGNRCVDK